MLKNTLIAIITILSTWASCCCAFSLFSSEGPYQSAMSQPANRILYGDPAFWIGDAGTMWERMQQLPLKQLGSISVDPDPAKAAWAKLAIISKQYNNHSKQLASQLIAWRNAYPSHPGNILFPDNATLTTLMQISPAKHIALLLPLQGPLASSGHAVQDGFLSAYYEALAKTHVQQTISFYDTSSNPNLKALYQQAIAQGADVIVGPLTQDAVKTISGTSSSVPTLALNYTDFWGSLPNNFYEFGLSPNDEAQQVADKAWRDGHSNAIIISPKNAWGERVSNTLVKRWESNGGKISDTLSYTSQTDFNAAIANLLHINRSEDREKMKTDNNKISLEQQRRQDFDVIFLLAEPQPARAIVPLLRFYYADNIPIYSTSIIYSGSPNPQKDVDLNGIIFTDTPWTLLSHNPNRMNAVGRDAYQISNKLSRLTQLANFPLYATTGALTLNSNHQIYRRLPWTKIENGHP